MGAKMVQIATLGSRPGSLLPMQFWPSNTACVTQQLFCESPISYGHRPING